jgi:hypothetical protein
VTLYIIAFVGGLLTIASPCILPVLPFVFAGNPASSFRRRQVTRRPQHSCAGCSGSMDPPGQSAPDSEGGATHVPAEGVQAAADLSSIESSETYVGYDRQENFTSQQAVAKDRTGGEPSCRSPAIN